jgi:ribosomal protein L32
MAKITKAMIVCPECNKKHLETEEICPHCGYSDEDEQLSDFDDDYYEDYDEDFKDL